MKYLFVQLLFTDDKELVHYIPFDELEDYFIKYPVNQKYLNGAKLLEMRIQSVKPGQVV